MREVHQACRECKLAAMLLCVYPRLLLAAAHAGLGPGRGAWRVDTAENHGLDGAALKIAADLTAQFAPTRNCLVVVKDGVLIAEEYLELALRSLHSAYGLDTA